MDTSISYQIHLPKALLTGIETSLKEILFNNSYSDKAVASMLKAHTAWGSRDRKTATRIVYDITRSYIRYEFIRQSLPDLKTSSSNEAKIRTFIMLSIFFDETLRQKLEINTALETAILSLQIPSEDIQHSLQPWIWQAIVEDWQDKAGSIIASLDTPAPVYIRYNSLKTTAQKLNQELDKLKIDYEYDAKVGGAIRINSNNQLRQTNAFKEGLFEFQDIGSQHIVKQSGIKPGQVVVDYCAGKGGKTLQIAGLMKNEGRIIASDIDPTRLTQLQKRAQKAGIKNLELMPNHTLADKKNLLADIVLIDAPCSGLGTLRRQPDIKFRLDSSQLQSIVNTQAEILDKARHLLRTKGKLVYATCSILKKENSFQIEKFLSDNKDFQLLHEEYILPEMYNGDGFYMAVLEKQSS